ncbi:MAG: PspA/IM30 family protein [Armatimonadetes bacterium]|nr:PspA/IM30 family protein [Armatimonadota bacterium]
MNFWQKLIGDTPSTGQPTDDDFDPNALLEQAQREMQEMFARNRERAVQVITEKNKLEQLVKDLERRAATLHEKADLAEARGDAKEADALRRDAVSEEASLTETRARWEEAKAVADSVKAKIKSEEERLRQRTAEAMLLKAQWNTMQVQRSLFASLVEVNTGSIAHVPPAERAVRHAVNRRFVRQALVQRDNLRQMQNDAAKRVNSLRENAKQARSRDNDDLENALLREMEQYEAIFVQTRDAAFQAGEVTERAAALLEEEGSVLRSQGIDPQAISDEQVTLYEARTALAGAENERDTRHNRQRGNLQLAVLLFVLAAIALLLAFL